MYRFFLNNSLVEEAQGWDNLASSIKRDKELRAILLTQDGTFEFTGNAYEYLWQLFQDNYCNEVDVRIEESKDSGNNWTYFYEGVIKVPAITFDEYRHVASCIVEDNSYYSRINNAKSIGAYLYGSKSRNGADITPCTLYNIKYFHVSTGSYITQALNGGYEGGAYKVYDCLRYMIEWMSDGRLSFISDTFGSGGEFENYFITIGRAIELYDQSITDPDTGADISPPFTETLWKQFFPKITFNDLIKEIGNRFNIKLIIEYGGENPTVRIEPESWFDQSGTMFRALLTDSIKTKTATQYIYNKINFGSSGIEDDLGGTHFPATIDFLGYKEEEFAITGDCSVDNSLNIKCDWVTSSNVIEYCVENGALLSTKVYDSAVFLIQAEPDSGTNYFASKGDWLNYGFYFYNPLLTNYEVAKRYLGSVPNAIVDYLAVETNDYQASKTTDNITVPNFVDFDDDSNPPNYDTGGNYNNSTYTFTAPLNAIYTWNIRINARQLSGHSFNMLVAITSSGGQSTEQFINMFGGGPVQDSIVTLTLYMNATETCHVEFVPTPGGTFTFNAKGSYWKLVAINHNGMIYGYDPADYPIIQHEFTYPLTSSQFNTIKNNPCKYIEFAMDGQVTRKALLESLKYDHTKGQGTFILMSSKNMNK